MAFITYNDGSTYSGDLIKGVKYGQGKYSWSDGSVYSGTFVDGERTGPGAREVGEGWGDCGGVI